MIKKAVIPAAGFGTRFLPVTKAQPKEMLPIVDTPTIQYVVEEAVNSGIRDILIITGRGKQSIENHFDRAFELEANLQAKGREEQLLQVRKLSSLANIHFIRQSELNGLGDAISYAKWHVDDEPFLVLLGDTLIDSPYPCSRQLIDTYNRFKAPVIGVEEVNPKKVERYGIIGGEEVAENTFKLDVLVEKPKQVEAPSNLAIAGRYVLTPDIFEYIEKTAEGVGNEIQLTDALQLMLKDREIYANRFEGKRFDIGNRLDYVKTTVEFAVKRKDIGPEVKAYLKKFVETLD
ncbi:MAG: UTP--glucose-1-phosphate uridylyltransferase GalU [Candidatus Sumerlaeia bacterium]